MTAINKNVESLVGRNPDELTLVERRLLQGHWIALEVYTPANLALRRIAAIADSAGACRALLRGQGLELTNYEYRIVR